MRNHLLNLVALAAFLATASSVRAAGVDCTSQDTRRKIANIVSGGTEKLNDAYIREVQQCLVDRGCYTDPRFVGREVDGIVRGRTEAALKLCTSRMLPRSQCGDGQVASYVLTSADIADLKKAKEAQKPSPENSDSGELSGNSPDDQPVDEQAKVKPKPGKPPMSDELLAALATLQDAEYPSRFLFENALDFFTNDQKVTKAELAPFRADLIGRACKSHASGDPVATWAAESNHLMVNVLSQPTYGFYPFWRNSPAPPEGGSGAPPPPAKINIDFSLLSRIGWFAVTFADDGALVLQDSMLKGDGAARQIELARRYRTAVDLVVYRSEDPSWWTQQMSQAGFADRLSTSIASEVGAELPGFLNRLQRSWLFLPPLTSAPTAWDGVTVNFEGYPYDDDVAMGYFSNFIRMLRTKLGQHEIWQQFRKTNTHNLDLNVVIPFQYLFNQVPGSGSSSPYLSCTPGGSEQWGSTDGENKTLSALAALVPKSKDEIASFRPGGPNDDNVDRFIVFLPECTSPNKKLLRLAIENAFDRTSTVKLALLHNPDLAIATWRAQMLGKITYVLFPGTWSWKGDFYKKPGRQFYDDMVYGGDNFSGVGFWPMPEYDSVNPQLATDILSVFKSSDTNVVQKYLTPAAIKIVGIGFANWIGAWRREIALVILVLLVPLVIYYVLALWFIELRQFHDAHKKWFIGLGLVILAMMFMLVLFDRQLNPFAMFFIVGVGLLAIGLFLVRQYIVSRTERDLP